MALNILRIHHVALHVVDLDKSIHFYGEQMGLPPLLRPSFDFPGAWFQLGVGYELHLIGNRNKPVHSHNRGTHIALAVANVIQTTQFLQQQLIPHFPPKQRPDGVWQVFATDPDGYFIEFTEVTQTGDS